MSEAMIAGLIGHRIHVHTNGPRGWDGIVRSRTGSTLTVITGNGVRHLVDASRVAIDERI